MNTSWSFGEPKLAPLLLLLLLLELVSSLVSSDWFREAKKSPAEAGLSGSGGSEQGEYLLCQFRNNLILVRFVFVAKRLKRKVERCICVISRVTLNRVLNL